MSYIWSAPSVSCKPLLQKDQACPSCLFNCMCLCKVWICLWSYCVHNSYTAKVIHLFITALWESQHYRCRFWLCFCLNSCYSSFSLTTSLSVLISWFFFHCFHAVVCQKGCHALLLEVYHKISFTFLRCSIMFIYTPVCGTSPPIKTLPVGLCVMFMYICGHIFPSIYLFVPVSNTLSRFLFDFFFSFLLLLLVLKSSMMVALTSDLSCWFFFHSFQFLSKMVG